jgi:1-acyl-sn-glycerol-3-phosphate acyltransferase
MAGFCTIAKRVKVPIVPAAIEGAFQGWPRTRSFPRPGRVVVEFGAPLAAEEVARLSEAELLTEVDRRIRQCHEAARARLNSAKSPKRAVSSVVL